MIMSLMRAFLLLPFLAACGGAGGDASTPAPGGEPDARIDCRIGSARAFERFCSYEIAGTERGRMLTIRKPDGGFRRLLLTEDGTGVAAADGAERPEVAILDEGRIEVTIGGDSFRLPATVGGR